MMVSGSLRTMYLLPSSFGFQPSYPLGVVCSWEIHNEHIALSTHLEAGFPIKTGVVTGIPPNNQMTILLRTS